MQRAAVEMAKQWRGDKMLRQLEAMLIVMDKTTMLLVSGTGEVIEPDDGILAIGSGGNYALSAGRALKQYASEHLTAKQIAKASLDIAGDICVYKPQYNCGRIRIVREAFYMHLHFTPRQIVEKLDQYIIGQKDAKKAVAVALRNRYRRSKLAENLRDEIAPKIF